MNEKEIRLMMLKYGPPHEMPEPDKRVDAQGCPLPGSLDHPGWPEPDGALTDFEDLAYDKFRRSTHIIAADEVLDTDPDIDLEAWMENNVHQWKRRWMDHMYVEVIDGETVWVCHPYELDSGAYKDFCALEQMGYRIHVTGASKYYPGATVRVAIYAPADRPFVGAQHDLTWLYRMFDAHDNLLYVGISKSAFARFEQHSHDKPWINQVVRWEREQYPTRAAALVAEKAAIIAERPRYNIIHNKGAA